MMHGTNGWMGGWSGGGMWGWGLLGIVLIGVVIFALTRRSGRP
jgi:hypothetical protein